MSWALDKKNTGSINDGGSKLPLGDTVHEIVKIGEQVNTQNPAGNEKQVVIETTSKGSSYKIYLSVESATESVSNIARKTLFAFWEQGGFGDEACKPERLKKLVGKSYTLTVEETEGKKGTKNEGKKFTNIKKVFAFDDDADEEPEEEEAETESEEEAEEQEEEAPKAAGKKAMPWKK